MSKNTLKRGNIKRDPYIDLDIYFWTHILQVEINIDISTFIFGSGHTDRNLNIYIDILFDKHSLVLQLTLVWPKTAGGLYGRTLTEVSTDRTQ